MPQTSKAQAGLLAKCHEKTEQETNPKDAVGRTKVPFSTLPFPPLAEAAVAMFEGASKYGRHNYRAASVAASVYFDAALRHLISWYEGEDIDSDSGISHVTKAIASLLILRDAQLLEKCIDDRPIRSTEKFSLSSLQPDIAALAAKHPNPPAPFTQKRP